MPSSRYSILFSTLAAAAAFATSPNGGQAQTRQQAESFVRKVYLPFKLPDEQLIGESWDFKTFAPQALTPELTQLLLADVRRTPEAKGIASGNLLCACMGTSGYKIAKLRTNKESPVKAVAKVDVKVRHAGTRRMTLHLIWMPVGWRIDDIGSPEYPSFRQDAQ